MLPLHTTFSSQGALPPRPIKVLGLDEALTERYPLDRVLLDLRQGPLPTPDALEDLGIPAVIAPITDYDFGSLFVIHALTNPKVVEQGDVVRVRDGGRVSVLFRRAANANSLFVTERCNSLCLMCSQPPRIVDDAWRIAELLDLLPLIDPETKAIAITGGEPTLLGAGLRRLIDGATLHLPNTQINVLTNARLLEDATLTEALTSSTNSILWAVPLYGHIAALHDYVVQSKGAFDQTLNGIYNLAERSAAIEIRIVVHKQTAEHLEEIADFLWRTMPFVAHVAFMGLEPMGYARVNRDRLYIDPVEYRKTLEAATWYLHDRGIRTSIYNTPLCFLSREIRPLAKRSISDWKNTFVAECDQCTAKTVCAGFFASADESWRSQAIKAIKKEICPCPGLSQNMCAVCSVGQVPDQSRSPVEASPH